MKPLVNGIFYITMKQPKEDIALCDDLQPLITKLAFTPPDDFIRGLMNLHRESCIKVSSTILEPEDNKTRWRFIMLDYIMNCRMGVVDYMKKDTEKCQIYPIEPRQDVTLKPDIQK